MNKEIAEQEKKHLQSQIHRPRPKLSEISLKNFINANPGRSFTIESLMAKFGAERHLVRDVIDIFLAKGEIKKVSIKNRSQFSAKNEPQGQKVISPIITMTRQHYDLRAHQRMCESIPGRDWEKSAKRVGF